MIKRISLTKLEPRRDDPSALDWTWISTKWTFLAQNQTWTSIKWTSHPKTELETPTYWISHTLNWTLNTGTEHEHFEPSLEHPKLNPPFPYPPPLGSSLEWWRVSEWCTVRNPRLGTVWCDSKPLERNEVVHRVTRWSFVADRLSASHTAPWTTEPTKVSSDLSNVCLCVCICLSSLTNLSVFAHSLGSFA